VFSDPDSSTLRPDAAAVIADAAKTIPAGARVALVGVADQRGNAEANQKLSEDRARAVQKAFEAGGLKASYTISAKGAEPNTDLQQARRVEITAT
jgi:outer membrane protein OmpA-like peptidoglycan-associated protein